MFNIRKKKQVQRPYLFELSHLQDEYRSKVYKLWEDAVRGNAELHVQLTIWSEYAPDLEMPSVEIGKKL